MHASDPARQREYDECLRRNLNNPHVRLVHNLTDADPTVPDEFASHPKYRQHPLGHWLKYGDALAYAANFPGEVFALLNADIFLDEMSDWPQCASHTSDLVFCLSRHEFDRAGPAYDDPDLRRLAFANAQDAWIFRAPLTVPDCDFELGTLGCDNAFAERLKRAGHFPVNAASRYRILHYDRARGKTVADAEAIHLASRPQPHPERTGQYLLPDIDQLRSVDQVLDALNVPPLQRYRVLCDALSSLFKPAKD